jgi:hypothetical protein
MKASEFFEKLAKMEPGILNITPGPFGIRIGKADIEAAQFIIDWYAKLGDMTLGDVLDILDALRWWLTFWDALASDEEELQ